MPIPVASLLRVSTVRQAKRQTGHNDGELDIPSQRQTISEFLGVHPDWRLVREFVEAGVSAYSNSAEEREILQDVLSAAGRGEFKVLVVWKQDRLSRNSLQYTMILNTFRKHGVEVWSVADGKALSLDNQTDKVVRFLEGWQAESESINTSIRTRERMRQLAAEGRWNGGKTPFGYQRTMAKDGNGDPVLVDGRPRYDLAPHPLQAPFVQEMFRRYLAGDGYKNIAMWLNTCNVPTYSGVPWGTHTVADIITNPFYAGMVCYGKTRVIIGSKNREKAEPVLAPGKHPPLIDRETWEKAVDLRKARTTIAKRQRSSEFPLAGVARCGVCGSTLFQWVRHYQRKDGHDSVYRVYRCTNRKVRKTCEVTGYRADLIEDLFLAEVQALSQPSGLRAVLQAQAEDERARLHALLEIRRRAQNRLKDIDEALRRLNRAYLEAGTIDDHEYAVQKAEYRSEQASLQEELDAPMPVAEAKDFSALAKAATQIRENWQYLQPQERKAAVLGLISSWDLRVIVHPGPRVELQPNA